MVLQADLALAKSHSRVLTCLAVVVLNRHGVLETDTKTA